MRKISIILLIVLLSSPFYLNIQLVHADEPATLADAINNVVSNIQATDAWTAVYNQIFDLQNQSAFDNAILQAYAQNDSLDVFFIARLGELNNYTSQVINDTLYATLEQGVPYFTMYDRYMVSAYQYAQEFNVSGWNITALYSEVTGVYPALYLTGGGFGRYYDEYAESLSMLLELDKAGLDTTAQMAVDWLSTQNLWNNPVSGNAEINEATGQPYANAAGGFYRYSFGDPICECEMGNFAQIITEYQDYAGTIPYFDRVITDLQTKLLVDGFSSPAWGTVGVIQHATSNSQLRLGETMGVLIALQMLYPYLSQDMQCIFAGMLQSGMWQGLLASSLYNNGQFKFLSTDTGYSSDASSLAAMMMFLDGIVPDIGYLAINASNEAYQDYRTCFPTSEWSFNYHDQSIRIPVMQGNLSFLFGSEEVSQNFPSNGVYNIQFANDWNSILSVTQVTNITSVMLQPLVLQPIPPIVSATTPISTPSPSPTPKPTATPVPSPTPIPRSTSTPAPTPTLVPTTSPTTNMSMQTYGMAFVIFAMVVIGIAAVAVYVKKVKPR